MTHLVERLHLRHPQVRPRAPPLQLSRTGLGHKSPASLVTKKSSGPPPESLREGEGIGSMESRIEEFEMAELKRNETSPGGLDPSISQRKIISLRSLAALGIILIPLGD